LDAFEYEKGKLTNVLNEISLLKKRLERVPRYYGKDIVEQALDDQRQNQLKNLAIAQEEPYFGRLDFQEKGTDQIIPLYIGKVGVELEETNKPLVIDWRAPISSMFYSFTGDSSAASYSSPDGVIEGDVHLKRNIAIRNQTLLRVVDSYVRGRTDHVGVTDEFLLYRLSEHKDNRLQDIVSTIQLEQNQIIREDYNKALIIQGVPGSGKTTVALHRLAFLLYQYQKKIKPEKVIIFAPNKMFMDYISDVLPELGVGDIQQTTFEEWARSILGNDLIIRNRHQQLSDGVRFEDKGNSADYKGSNAFLNDLQLALCDYETSFVPDEDFEAWDQIKLSAETIRNWFFQEYRHYPFMKRKDRIFTRIKRWIDSEYKNFREMDSKGALKKQANKNFNAYKRKWPNHTVVRWYKSIIGEKWSPKKKELSYEDLAPLVYIHNRFYGIDSKYKYHHVVIDEAQDFSPFQISLLQDHCPNQAFTILGDILQNIYAFQGIHQWEEFTNLFQEDKLHFYQLDRSYRSTMEIIYFANAIIKKYQGEITPAKPVFRSGEPVQVVKKSKEEQVDWIRTTVTKLMKNKVHTIAIIGRDDESCEEIHKFLSQSGVIANLIDADQQEYHGGVSIVPIYLAKGMEFDAVILTDVDENHYPDDAFHAKLLYVGCTRALHHLYIMHDLTLSPLVSTIYNK
jgi:DNA helicase-2/ATP-dependent DNA helicase PcrA